MDATPSSDKRRAEARPRPLDEFHGPNAGYVASLYDKFSRDPESVAPEIRREMERWQEAAEPQGDGAGQATPDRTTEAIARAVAGAVDYARSIREYGHLDAQLDPLGSPPLGDPSLSLASHGLTAAALDSLPAWIVGGPIAEQGGSALDAAERLRARYSGTLGHDFGHIRVPEERAWLTEAAESGRFHPSADPIDYAAVLEQLTSVEAFELFLHRVFPGRHRFSIEGLDAMVPMLDELVHLAVEDSTTEVILGMAHRGRLSVMTHVLHRPFEEILAEFRDPMKAWNLSARNDLGWTGDVKYHQGAVKLVKGGAPADLCLTLVPNPSHLEFVNPVLQGLARAAGSSTDQPGAPRFDPHRSLPVSIHGDAAFPGQGVVAETLNLSRLDGYKTGGTLHIIANNQLGFTTLPSETRSTHFASDLARGFRIPVLHVNADDPEGCIEAIRIAYAYRWRFQRDFLVDLIGYRRYGHNEGDEPRFTQPEMYERIDRHPRITQLWGSELESRGLVPKGEVERQLSRHAHSLQRVYESLAASAHSSAPEPGSGLNSNAAAPRIDLALLSNLNDALLELPKGFNLHPKLSRARTARADTFERPDDPSIDWGTAEELAFGSILADGVPIRLSGEDTERGTFNHRHAVLHDTETGATHVPLQKLAQARASFEVINSPLSEVAAVGFEYGYNIEDPRRLVLWEAQYGDFGNVAQVIFDEFVFSGRAKWGQRPSLVLLLPHGHEGQGPDHSTARPERFLQLAADGNLMLAYPTTAAQYFHLIRSHAASLGSSATPLVVLTPKGLLRHPRAQSSPRELAEGRWRPVIHDARSAASRAEVQRLALCSGKVFVDIVTSDTWQDAGPVALARVEQLYPFPREDLEALVASYPNLTELVWVQEEPENMGAWDFARSRLRQIVRGQIDVNYIGRPRSASPAEGVAAWHKENQEDLIRHVTVLDTERRRGDLVARQPA